MKFHSIILLIFFLSLAQFQWSAVNAINRRDCSEKDKKNIEITLEKLVGFGKYQRKFPINNDEAKIFCRFARKDTNRLNYLFKLCFDGTAKNFITILLYSLNSSIKTYCNPKNKGKYSDLLKMSKCANEPESQKIIFNEISKYIDTIQKVTNLKPIKDGVGYVCCDYFKLLSNLEKKLNQSCTEKETQIVIDFIRNLIQSLIDMGCGDYSEGSDTCEKLQILPKILKKDKKYSNFLFPLVDFWNNLN